MPITTNAALQLDYSTIPFEVWCDLLEEQGEDTSELRQLFELVPQIDFNRALDTEGNGRFTSESCGAPAFYHYYPDDLHRTFEFEYPFPRGDGYDFDNYHLDPFCFDENHS